MSHADEAAKTRWRIVRIVCIILLILALLTAAGIYLLPRLTRHIVPTVPTESDPGSDPVERVENPIDFAALRETEPDVVGWIRIPGTVIDYEIMRSGKDVEESFYLHHAPDRSYRYSGSIYMQRLNMADFSDPNTVLYGHYMKDGSMFADLHQFRKEKFFAEHEYIYVYTPGHILTYRIYSAFVYDNRHILNSFEFSDPVEYGEFLEQTLHPTSMKRQVRDGVSVTTDDRILTLSTCTTRSSERYLVEGVLIHDQLTY